MDKAERLASELYPEMMEWKRVIDFCTPYGPHGTRMVQDDANYDKRKAFISGYKLSQKDTIERVCNWLEKNGCLVNLDALRDAMNEDGKRIHYEQISALMIHSSFGVIG